MSKLLLVNPDDVVTGYAEKLAVHRQGLLHRAFSVLIFNSNGEMLIQQRAAGKYHSGGLWSNACCSHQVQYEDQEATVQRRLREEMGFVCTLKFLYKFIYRAELDNNFTEHEYDHVYLGFYNEDPKPDTAEVQNYKWINLQDLQADMANFPKNYTYWFRLIVQRIAEMPAFYANR